MPTNLLIVIGASGHACVVIDAWLRAGGQSASIQVFDHNPALEGKLLEHGIKIHGFTDFSLVSGVDCHVAVGSNSIRDQLLQQVVAHGGRLKTIVHPSAVVALSARVGAGCFVAAGTVVSARAEIGGGTIVNHGAVVDHDCVVGAGCHVAPNGTLGGGVKLGDRVLVGAGAIVLPGRTIGSDTIIAAGAVLTRNAVANCTMVGIPAKRR